MNASMRLALKLRLVDDVERFFAHVSKSIAHLDGNTDPLGDDEVSPADAHNLARRKS